jgi:hypothetical protein
VWRACKGRVAVANSEHLAILKEGVETWNAWRRDHDSIRPDLTGANLIEADLSNADLTGAILRGVSLTGANLIDANLAGAFALGAYAAWAVLLGANLIGVNLVEADLAGADLSMADLTGANLTGANLTGASLVETNLKKAILSGCRVFGISTWEVETEAAIQHDLVITRRGRPEITVDNIEVAQFVYLLLHNPNISRVISTVANRAVLILGRFTAERKAVLARIKDALRAHGFVPILFDFEPAPERDVTETVQLLANLSRFVVADITDAKSIPQELSTIVPQLPSVPIQPILLTGQREYGMFDHWRRYPWVLPEFLYDDGDHLIANLEVAVIQPAIAKREAMRDSLAQEARIRELQEKVREQQCEIERLKGT